MKRKIWFSIFAVCAGISLSLNAQEYRIPKTAVIVSKQQANIRQSPSTNAPVVEKVSKGTLYELVGRKGEWYEAKNVKNQETVYLSTSVSNLVEGRFLPRTDKGLVEADSYTKFVYQKKTALTNKETISSYAFYQNKEKDVVYTTLSLTENSVSGRSFTTELYYKGKQMGWYLLFDEQVDMDGAFMNKLDQPIVVFSKAPQGIIVNGEFYAKTNNEF